MIDSTITPYTADVLAAVVMVPLVFAIATALVPGRLKNSVGMIGTWSTGALTALIVTMVVRDGTTSYALAQWQAPLGIELRADGLSVVFLALTALVGAVVSIYASGSIQVRGSDWFWPLWLATFAALNAVFISGDLFNLYVCLELVGVSAVGLVALGGESALRPALRYLFVAVVGSLFYLLGVTIIYAQTSTLDIRLAADIGVTGIPAATALGLIATGMALKTALVPVHSWLPSAHSSAPSAVSPLLSALVIKASLYVLIRVWSTVFANSGSAVPTALGLLGSIAIIWGALQAIRQDRLKKVVAYSTVAQVGYFFLLFPLVAPGLHPSASPAAVSSSVAAWSGVVTLVLGHGIAKASMFTAAGNIAFAQGGDELKHLGGAHTRSPKSVLAFAIAGASLAGLPPTFGFIGKWQVLDGAIGLGQWWWLPVLLIGGLLTAAYVVKVLANCFAAPEEQDGADLIVPARMEWVALGLALLSIVLGFTAVPILSVLESAFPTGGQP